MENSIAMEHQEPYLDHNFFVHCALFIRMKNNVRVPPSNKHSYIQIQKLKNNYKQDKNIHTNVKITQSAPLYITFHFFIKMYNMIKI